MLRDMAENSWQLSYK